MTILVTGSAGHLGEALVRTLQASAAGVIGLDRKASPYTTLVGSIVDPAFVQKAMQGVDAILHTATLHKPHVETHSRHAFVDTNITGTLNLLEEAVRVGVRAFVFTSTTSVFGRALRPNADRPAAWITEEVRPVPRNVYGVTKAAAEDVCELFHRDHGLPCLVLRTSRFFPEEDDDESVRVAYDAENAKTNEFLYRRVDLEDVVAAHLLALERAPSIGFGRYIISATTPFLAEDVAGLRVDAPSVVRQRVPEYEAEYERRGWRMFPTIDRVYVNDRARRDLGWEPRYDFRTVLTRLARNEYARSELSAVVGSKGYDGG
jgi:nucleoside-diphosphate-sugar epimerase